MIGAKTAVVLTLTITLGLLGTTHAQEQADQWPLIGEHTNQLCGTDMTDSNEYACADSDSDGLIHLLAKVNDSWYGKYSQARVEVNKSGDMLGSSPELKTYANTEVTATGYFDIDGTIHEPPGTHIFMSYGLDIYKKQWWGGWSIVESCVGFHGNSGRVDLKNEMVTCSAYNTGSNTYRVAAYALVTAQTYGTAAPGYADFATGDGGVRIHDLTLT